MLTALTCNYGKNSSHINRFTHTHTHTHTHTQPWLDEIIISQISDEIHTTVSEVRC